MKAWLIFSEEEWDSFSAKDPIHVQSSYYFTRDKNRDYIPYNWIKRQVSARLAPAPSPKMYPIKVHIQLEGKKSPDLRTIRHWPYSLNSRMTLVTITIPDEELLLADEKLWFYVVNHWYIPKNEKDANRHENAFTPSCLYDRRRSRNTRFQDEVTTSWERIFDLTIKGGFITSPRGKKSIIGWTWKISRSNIIRIRSFKGASSTLYSC
jgi:hypothetical protein